MTTDITMIPRGILFICFGLDFPEFEASPIFKILQNLRHHKDVIIMLIQMLKIASKITGEQTENYEENS
jgi:hypothetical protein